MFKKMSIGGLLTLLLAACYTPSDSPLLYWSFDNENSCDVDGMGTNIPFAVQTTKAITEYVNGVKGNGLRTDGYSTFVASDLPLSVDLNNMTISAWFAIESFPADTAYFYVLSDKNKENGAGLAVDRFGSVLYQKRSEGSVEFTDLNMSIDRFVWNHMLISSSDGKVDIYINGVKSTSQQSVVAPDSKANYIVIGNDLDTKYLGGLFPVSLINGLVDEVKIWNKGLGEKAIVAEYNSVDHVTNPDLSIPEVRFKNDFNRPKFHIAPAANWTNESHGLVYYKGRYHIFNQKNANGLFLGQINWGHYSSPDLLTWTEHRPILRPETKYDVFGIWSGHCFINDQGIPNIIYTANNGMQNGMCLAMPKDSMLLEWEKFEGNPVVNGVPDGYSRKDFRDPVVWKDNGNWYMIVGFGIVEDGIQKGALLLYKSTNLKDWTYLHLLFKGNPQVDDSGIFWEMPTFWKFGDKYVLLVNKVPEPNKPAKAQYWVGQFKNERFIPDNARPKNLEVVNRLLSPSVSMDVDGNVVAIAIIPDEIPAKAQMENGWTHLFSIPRTWELVNNEIHQKPHPALKELRINKKSIDSLVLQNDTLLVNVSGSHQLEIIAELNPVDCSSFGFVVAANEDGSEQTIIKYQFNTNQFIVDRTKESLNPLIPGGIRTGNYIIDKNKKIKLHIFIDGSVVEVFIDNKDAFTTRMFPQNAESSQVKLFVQGGTLKVEGIDIYQLESSENKVDWELPTKNSN